MPKQTNHCVFASSMSSDFDYLIDNGELSEKQYITVMKQLLLLSSNITCVLKPRHKALEVTFPGVPQYLQLASQ